MQFFTLLKTLAALLPQLVLLVKGLEDAVPESGKGASKLAALREILESAHEVAEDVQGPFTTLWPVVEKVVGTLVRLVTK